MKTNNKIIRIIENKNPKHFDFKYNEDKENIDSDIRTTKFTTEESNTLEIKKSENIKEKEIIFSQLLDKINIEDVSLSIK